MFPMPSIGVTGSVSKDKQFLICVCTEDGGLANWQKEDAVDEALGETASADGAERGDCCSLQGCAGYIASDELQNYS